MEGWYQTICQALKGNVKPNLESTLRKVDLIKPFRQYMVMANDNDDWYNVKTITSPITQKKRRAPPMGVKNKCNEKE